MHILTLFILKTNPKATRSYPLHTPTVPYVFSSCREVNVHVKLCFQAGAVGQISFLFCFYLNLQARGSETAAVTPHCVRGLYEILRANLLSCSKGVCAGPRYEEWKLL